MPSERGYIEAIARLTASLNAFDWTGKDTRFTFTLDTMAMDAQRWLDNEWATPSGSTTPVERSVVVLTQDLIVLLGHSANAGVRHVLLTELAQTAIDAAAQEIIVDPAHRDYFTHPESPLHAILEDEKSES